MKQDALDKLIEDYKPEDGVDSDLLASVPEQALAIRRERKQVRYKLYRMRSEKEGKSSATMVDDDFRAFYSSLEHFDGWQNFAITWDVALDDPTRLVHRDKSEGEEWEELVAATYPIIEPGGKIVYPDKRVQQAIAEHHADSNSAET